MWSVRWSEVYYWCVNTINCTGQNKSAKLLQALGEADGNMYMCSKELRPSENKFFIITSANRYIAIRRIQFVGWFIGWFVDTGHRLQWIKLLSCLWSCSLEVAAIRRSRSILVTFWLAQ